MSEQGGTLACFGLWSYCDYDENFCRALHDDIVEGKDVPSEKLVKYFPGTR